MTLFRLAQHVFLGSVTTTTTTLLILILMLILMQMQIQTSSAFATPLRSTWTNDLRYNSQYHLSKDPMENRNSIENSIATEETPQFILRGDPDDELSEQMWEDIQTGEPPKWIIVKEVSVSLPCFNMNELFQTHHTISFAIAPGN